MEGNDEAAAAHPGPEGADIYGEGVNVAARLETLAEPGGVCISAKVYEEVEGKVGSAFEDMAPVAWGDVPTTTKTAPAVPVQMES